MKHSLVRNVTCSHKVNNLGAHLFSVFSVPTRKEWMNLSILPIENNEFISLKVEISSNYGSFSFFMNDLCSKSSDTSWMPVLAGMSNNDFLNNMTSGNHKTLDSESIVILAEQRVIDNRKTGKISNFEARATFDALNSIKSSNNSAEYILGALSMMPLFNHNDIESFKVKFAKSSFKEFMTYLWHPFANALFEIYLGNMKVSPAKVRKRDQSEYKKSENQYMN
jgi:hypothetical protein